MFEYIWYEYKLGKKCLKYFRKKIYNFKTWKIGLPHERDFRPILLSMTETLNAYCDN